MYVIIVHVIIVHSIMLCYPIIINVSHIKENTPTCTLTSTCTQVHAHVHANLYHNLHKTERRCVSASIGISVSLSDTITTMTQKLMQISFITEFSLTCSNTTPIMTILVPLLFDKAVSMLKHIIHNGDSQGEH